jgi:DMSO/TMAO reductase YedYZ molybdopterin-dependent catalytic subunit
MTSLVRSLLFFAVASGLSAAEPVLTVTAPDRTLTFTQEEFTALPHMEITATDPHGGASHKYSGVAMQEILARAGAPLGDKLRGRALQLMVIAHSRDGYAIAFALAEFDPSFNDRSILLADAQDGGPLPDNASPLRMIIPGDKKAARWARMVTSMEIRSAVPAAPAAKP